MFLLQITAMKISKTMRERPWIMILAISRFLLAGLETCAIIISAWYYIKSLGESVLFVAFVLSAYNVGIVIVSPFGGFLTDRVGNPKCFFICSSIAKVIAYVMYSVNLSPYFPLFGRFLSGLSEVGITVLLGQIALQADEKSRGRNFVLLDCAYCIGYVLGPAIGGFITFQLNVFGWKIDQGNSPGIAMAMIFLLFLIFSLLAPSDIWMTLSVQRMDLNSILIEDEYDKDLNDRNQKHNPVEHYSAVKASDMIRNSRIAFLLVLIFFGEAVSCTAIFYVPILALDHFHLELLHVKLLFFNCTLFTIVVFICLYIASRYFEERILFAFSFFLQIIAISFLAFLAFSWDQITSNQYYILLVYICFGMPYFSYALGTSLLSKVTDRKHASFVQGVSYATLHLSILINRAAISFVFTKMSLIYFCSGMAIVWLAVVIWYCILFKRLVPES